MPRESRAGARVCGPGRASTLPVHGKPRVGKIVLPDYPAWRGLGGAGRHAVGMRPEMELTFTRPRWAQRVSTLDGPTAERAGLGDLLRYLAGTLATARPGQRDR